MIPDAWSPALSSRIEDAGLNASAPAQQRWVDGWLLRYSPGKAQRARCINALSDGVLALQRRLALCREVFDEAGLPMLLRITPFSRPAKLDERLDQLGYRHHDDSLVMACASIQPDLEEPLPESLRFEDISSEAFAHIVGEFRKSTAPAIEAHVQRLRTCPVPYRAIVIRDGAGDVLAGGQSAAEAGMVGLYDVFTVESARGRGLARRLCGRLLVDALAEGARLAYLQVDARNHAARALYHRLGFADAYGYHYRSAP